MTPGDFPKKTLLVNSGAEALENSVKVARYWTERPGVIVFEQLSTVEPYDNGSHI
jgi:4-aminobutyrate aminotransferase/(S)-3-amino-2-methylpropionate transaminase